ncbi:PEP-CTERM sorting domain-containing protein [Neptunicella marina]|uniref:PEP-CTERM sorting domain-containing protein n=1 Tax=Neptunicella marina TaxID=2125989 RepID=A0A8J6M2S4_9ALTE|nr:PEP-CTERM sorting domain-containing protein [Neptunicella marina]MBC3764721.1 PEP-CTERM sorting domain-containing protein [Neptunicella marina]
MLKLKNLFAAAILAATSLVTTVANADVILAFQPTTSTDVNVGESITVNLVASTEFDGDAFLGWGLDLNFDSALVSLESMLIAPNFIPPFVSDDGLGGLLAGFPSVPPVLGSNILLATLTFKALGAGLVDLLTSATLGDANEGFSGFQSISFSNASIGLNIKDATNGQVPEPSLLALFVIAAMGLVRLRRRKA